MQAPADEFENDINENGDPVALDLVLSSDLPHPEFSDGNEDGLLDGPSGFLLDEPSLDLEDEFPVQLEKVEKPRKGRAKAGEQTPVVLTENADGSPVSVYQRLIDYGLLKKITDIVMAKVSMPWNLREDASQEVHSTWARLKANPKFARNQMARYAYMSGQHAALKLRRDIGAVVAIPGALFRTGRNTSFMESIGAAVNPKDVDDYKDSLELSVEPDDMLHLVKVSEIFFEERLGNLNLSQKQRLIAKKALVERMAADDIAAELDIPLMYVERLLNQVTQKVRAADGDIEPAKSSSRGSNSANRVPRSYKKSTASAGELALADGGNEL